MPFLTPNPRRCTWLGGPADGCQTDVCGAEQTIILVEGVRHHYRLGTTITGRSVYMHNGWTIDCGDAPTIGQVAARENERQVGDG